MFRRLLQPACCYGTISLLPRLLLVAANEATCRDFVPLLWLVSYRPLAFIKTPGSLVERKTFAPHALSRGMDL